jgi:soluble lytic murein transglycosylase
MPRAADDRVLAAKDAAQRGDRAKLARQLEALRGHELEPYVEYWLLQPAPAGGRPRRAARVPLRASPAATWPTSCAANGSRCWASAANGMRSSGISAARPVRPGNHLLRPAEPPAPGRPRRAGRGAAALVRRRRAAGLLHSPDGAADRRQAPRRRRHLGADAPPAGSQEARRGQAHRGLSAGQPGAVREDAGCDRRQAAAPPGAAADHFAASRQGREMALFAVQRTGPQRPLQAAQQWEGIKDKFSAADRGYVYGQLGWQGRSSICRRRSAGMPAPAARRCRRNSAPGRRAPPCARRTGPWCAKPSNRCRRPCRRSRTGSTGSAAPTKRSAGRRRRGRSTSASPASRISTATSPTTSSAAPSCRRRMRRSPQRGGQGGGRPARHAPRPGAVRLDLRIEGIREWNWTCAAWTTPACWRRPNWRTATTSTTAPSTPPTAPWPCTTTRCATWRRSASTSSRRRARCSSTRAGCTA